MIHQIDRIACNMVSHRYITASSLHTYTSIIDKVRPFFIWLVIVDFWVKRTSGKLSSGTFQAEVTAHFVMLFLTHLELIMVRHEVRLLHHT